MSDNKNESSMQTRLLRKRPSLIGSRSMSTSTNNDFSVEELKKLKIQDMPRWNLGNYESLPDTPMLYVPERSHLVVFDSPDNIESRLLDCMRFGSMTGVFNGQQATAQICAMDHSGVCVQLFKDSTLATKEKKGILVEIQRKNCNSFKFHNIAKTLLHAARGSTPPKSKTSFGRPPPLLLNRKAPAVCNIKHNTEVAIENAAILLKKDRMDANMLGMESLILLTDKQCSAELTCLLTSRAVLKGDVPDIKSIILGNDRHGEDKISNGVHYSQIRNYALLLLANSLSVVASNKDEFRSIVRMKEWESMLSALLLELKNVESTPHSAYQSARSINTLISGSPEMRNMAIILDAPALVLQCQDVGRCQHALLGNVSETIVNALSQHKNILA